MALFKSINNKAKTIDSSGFGTSASNYGGRFVNKNGDANVRKKGIGFLERTSWHHFMLTIPRWQFFGIIILFYFLANLFFATIYYYIGVEHLNGIIASNNTEKFGQAFFFSVQTFTTVGYGHINPTGFWASFVSSVEALTGLLTFAIATGLFFGRFSKPEAYIKFSENAIIAPYENGTALMFRMTPFKNVNLTDVEARVTLGLSIEENGKMVNKFYQLPLELDKVNALTLSWTLVHPITEKSPLYNFTAQDYGSIDGEILVFIKVFDDIYSTHLVKRTSYIFKEVVYGAKFNIMYNQNEDDSVTILDLQKLNSFEKVTLP
ncbi:MAG: Inward rectifier potassium channel Irk [Flavobacterium sp.]|uniref:ion channel n=1 Tax=Flavobacterium sp. TaxID=239 RepID=UPI000C669F00|nr:ion channel [Flavobacterium sp.]MBF04754.1 Inward rectifier potassium channel Irk [Flavobacterium sp.]|tara:strand:- start:73 stop:1032 length:960 start_codon:yes stop_codon:yes gene_type:complete